ncbi:MAG: aminopeptidase, partial [Anaerolineae bacterium]|nr:aminopeptidase [Anaerolineae bacterium]
MNFEAKLEKYAEVIVKVGLNVQEGQRLLITVHDQGVELARAVAKAAYQAGARYVGVIYNDIDIIKFWLQYGSEESLDEVLLDQMDLVGKYGRREDTILS